MISNSKLYKYLWWVKLFVLYLPKCFLDCTLLSNTSKVSAFQTGMFSCLLVCLTDLINRQLAAQGAKEAREVEEVEEVEEAEEDCEASVDGTAHRLLALQPPV